MDDHDANSLRDKAAYYRSLAKMITDQMAMGALLEIAADLEAKALKSEAAGSCLWHPVCP